MKNIILKSGLEMPVLAQGTWTMQNNDVERVVKFALETGFRHIDTADIYANHREVGQAIKESGVSREEIFLTTKVWRETMTKKDLVDSGKRFLDELQSDYLDLLLIHWPNHHIPLNSSIDGLLKLKEEGVCRAIGVSNFTVHHLEDYLKISHEMDVNQVEFHPSLNQKKLYEFCQMHEITLSAYSPIAQGQDLLIPQITELAEKHKKSNAQIILSWLRSKNIVAITGSRNEYHIKENFESQDLHLSEEEIELIDSLDIPQNRLVKPDFNEFDY